MSCLIFYVHVQSRKKKVMQDWISREKERKRTKCIKCSKKLPSPSLLLFLSWHGVSLPPTAFLPVFFHSASTVIHLRCSDPLLRFSLPFFSFKLKFLLPFLSIRLGLSLLSSALQKLFIKTFSVENSERRESIENLFDRCTRLALRR